MNAGEILVIIILIILVCGVSPFWGYSAAWGFGPSGLGLLLVLLLLFIIIRRR